MYRATYFVTLMVETPVGGESLPEALAAAQKKVWSQFAKVKPGVELINCQLQVYGVSNMNVNGEM